MEVGDNEFQKANNGELRPQSQVLERPEVNWLNGLKDRFTRKFKKEIRGGLPKIKIDIFYSPHGSAEDVYGLKDQFQKCDIYLPETFGWKPDFLNTLRGLSNGNVTPEMALQVWGDTNNPYFYSRDKEFFKIIYKSKKPIAFIDIPDSHSLVMREKENKIPKIHFGSNFGQAIDSIRGYIEKAADMQEERETYMLDQLQPQIQELLKTHPELRGKQEINTLVSIGVAHTLLYRYLKEDYQTTRKFSKMPMIFRYTEEALRRHMFNKPADDDLFARIATEWSLFKAHRNIIDTLTNDSLKKAIAIRRLISRFSFDELKDMFEEARDINEWANMFVERAKERVKVPTPVK